MRLERSITEQLCLLNGTRAELAGSTALGRIALVFSVLGAGADASILLSSIEREATKFINQFIVRAGELFTDLALNEVFVLAGAVHAGVEILIALDFVGATGTVADIVTLAAFLKTKAGSSNGESRGATSVEIRSVVGIRLRSSSVGTGESIIAGSRGNASFAVGTRDSEAISGSHSKSSQRGLHASASSVLITFDNALIVVDLELGVNSGSGDSVGSFLEQGAAVVSSDIALSHIVTEKVIIGIITKVNTLDRATRARIGTAEGAVALSECSESNGEKNQN